ncbi:hypothetical protein SBRY_10317 [Actinacidiphila bryophytorum]|uniref:Uncharacterized protein n=1 Tax=Actinacidiphila bryophytorum TaxID=1436133 RepID=A0A9W4E080_9ACTN|nr:hypothetical protein SBRY_10317 [Actinacidiphila bryophytorum]
MAPGRYEPGISLLTLPFRNASLGSFVFSQRSWGGYFEAEWNASSRPGARAAQTRRRGRRRGGAAVGAADARRGRRDGRRGAEGRRQERRPDGLGAGGGQRAAGRGHRGPHGVRDHVREPRRLHVHAGAVLRAGAGAHQGRRLDRTGRDTPGAGRRHRRPEGGDGRPGLLRRRIRPHGQPRQRGQDRRPDLAGHAAQARARRGQRPLPGRHARRRPAADRVGAGLPRTAGGEDPGRRGRPGAEEDHLRCARERPAGRQAVRRRPVRRGRRRQADLHRTARPDVGLPGHGPRGPGAGQGPVRVRGSAQGRRAGRPRPGRHRTARLRRGRTRARRGRRGRTGHRRG